MKPVGITALADTSLWSPADRAADGFPMTSRREMTNLNGGSMSPRDKVLPGEFALERLEREMFGLRSPTTK
jgi:hypothetical protein